VTPAQHESQSKYRLVFAPEERLEWFCTGNHHRIIIWMGRLVHHQSQITRLTTMPWGTPPIHLV
jgi:hypothetical protein